MHERHRNKRKYFQEQVYTTEKYVIPYLQDVVEIKEGTEVMEIGCGEGGNMQPFLDLGCKLTGVDLHKGKIEIGRSIFEDHPKKESIKFICDDIYNLESLNGTFDIIILRDVIEHIHDQDKFMDFMKRFLKPNGVVFFGFPPWHNPFGGHQQICESSLLSKLPYFHLLPMPLFKLVLKLFGEKKRYETLVEIKETGISIERFERILRKRSYKILKRTHYLFNPNYEVKFKLNPREQFGIIKALPFIRNFFTTACYYVVATNK